MRRSKVKVLANELIESLAGEKSFSEFYALAENIKLEFNLSIEDFRKLITIAVKELSKIERSDKLTNKEKFEFNLVDYIAGDKNRY